MEWGRNSFAFPHTKFVITYFLRPMEGTIMVTWHESKMARNCSRTTTPKMLSMANGKRTRGWCRQASRTVSVSKVKVGCLAPSDVGRVEWGPLPPIPLSHQPSAEKNRAGRKQKFQVRRTLREKKREGEKASRGRVAAKGEGQRSSAS